ARLDRFRQSREARIRAEKILEQLADRVRAQWPDRELLIVRALHPARAVLGPEVQEEEAARGRRRLDHRLDERLAPGVEPVEVLEERHGRLALPARLGDTADHGEELALACLRLETRRGVLGIGHAEEVEDDGERGAEGVVE